MSTLSKKGMRIVALAVFGFACAVSAQTTYQTVFSFGPTPATGSGPRSDLLEASDGWFYGTTYQGGSSNLGTIFRVARTGAGFAVLTNLWQVSFPFAGLVEGTDGALYGTASSGGSDGRGGVFKINKNGLGFQMLHEFANTAAEGNAPLGKLAKGPGGTLYGSTAGGGTNDYGTIFRVNEDGTGYTVIHQFSGQDGVGPVAGMILGSDGALYGTTKFGGSSDRGTVFRASPNGATYSILHHFRGQPFADGSQPIAPVMQATNGVLYGSTYFGGIGNDFGTVFKVNTNGTGFAVLHSFTPGGSDGTLPVAGLIQGGDGALYGTTPSGGTAGAGVVYRLNPDGTGYAVLHEFSPAGGSGTQPYASLIQASDSAFYGTTFYGGAYATNGAIGTIYKLVPSSAPAAPRIVFCERTGSVMVLGFAGGSAGQVYRILATTNQITDNWITIGSVPAAGDGTFQFTDSAAANFPLRFYRAVAP